MTCITPTAQKATSSYQRVYIVEENSQNSQTLAGFFYKNDIRTQESSNIEDAFDDIVAFAPQVLFVAFPFHNDNDISYLKKLREIYPDTVYLLLTHQDALDEAVPLLNSLVDDLVIKPNINLHHCHHIIQCVLDTHAKQEKKAASYTQSLQKQIKTLQKEKYQLIQKNRIKAFFIKNLSNHISIPLNQIIQFSNIGLQRIHRKQAALGGNYLAEVKLIAEEMMIFSNDLSEIASLETGESEFITEHIDIGEFFKMIKEQFQPVADDRNITFSINADLTWPCITADYYKFFKVCTILLRNAFRYTPNKGLVEITMHQQSDLTSITFRDNGPGIPKEKREHLFDLYEQSKLPDTQQPMGFGLSICKALMRGQGGNIYLHDTLSTDEGATFTLTLPTAHSVFF
ncbi:hybrid sensor histidine kinase/response regulator [Simkania negevensis]|uniref:histidine kinase n=1 Tax=Simkania negevensis TaxID=83561 RepID=A0ABS3ASK0_9BACT|nr:hybrid sensor histidine kinase/response regulator [Simkania negevensis]